MDFKQYVLEQMMELAQTNHLDIKINVAEWRSFEMPDDKNGLLFVIKYITGNYIGGIHTQPVQIFCYSELNDIENAVFLLDEFVKKHTQYQFMDGNDFVKINFETAVPMRNFIQSETGYRASVYAFGTFVICENISDIKQLLWVRGGTTADFDIEFLSANFGYIAVLNTTKYSGQELSVSLKQEAGLTMSLTVVNKNDDFCNTIKGIMFGGSSGNTTFKFKIKRTEDAVSTTPQEIEMKLESATLPSTKTAAPTLTLSFRR